MRWADALDGAVQLNESVSALTERDGDQDAPRVSHTVEDLASRAVLDQSLGRGRLDVAAHRRRSGGALSSAVRHNPAESTSPHRG
jgi:hypothetical protein